MADRLCSGPGWGPPEPLVADPALGSVAASRSSVVRLMVPSDANFTGDVFGGVVLSEVDRVAYIAACRHAGATCVTASFDRVDFLAPVHVGDVVDFLAELTFAGRTSMEVSVHVTARPAAGGERRAVAEAFVTMVAIDRAGRPTAVPSLRPSTEEERRRYEDGRRRTEERRRTRQRG